MTERPILDAKQWRMIQIALDHAARTWMEAALEAKKNFNSGHAYSLVDMAGEAKAISYLIAPPIKDPE